MEKYVFKAMELQKLCPDLILGGSIALFLYGFKLDRFEDDNIPKDIDIIVFPIIELGGKECNDSSFGNDFFRSEIVDGIKIEQCIHTEECKDFTIVNYQGYPFRLYSLSKILGFKKGYSLKGIEKHKKDLEQIAEQHSSNVFNGFDF